MGSVGLGLAVAVVSGLVNGVFMSPMKTIVSWRFMHWWFMYSVFLTILPLIVGFSSMNLIKIFKEIETLKLVGTIILGAAWGIGNLTFGIAIDILGQGLGFSIPLACCSAFGTLFPLILLHSEDVPTTKGYLDFTSLGIALIGIVFCGYAGYLKEIDAEVVRRAKQGFLEIVNDFEEDKPRMQHRSLIIGILLSILSGIFSACINIAYALGDDIIDKSTGPAVFKYSPIQTLTIPAGGLMNMLYASYLIYVDGSFNQIWYVRDFYTNSSKCFLSAVLWYGAMFLYGMACNLLGDLGVVVGFPIYIGLTIVCSNIAAYFYFYEWDQTSSLTKRMLLIGNFFHYWICGFDWCCK